MIQPSLLLKNMSSKRHTYGQSPTIKYGHNSFVGELAFPTNPKSALAPFFTLVFTIPLYEDATKQRHPFDNTIISYEVMESDILPRGKYPAPGTNSAASAQFSSWEVKLAFGFLKELKMLIAHTTIRPSVGK